MGKRTAPTRLACKPPSRRKRAKWNKLITLATETIIGWPSAAVTTKLPSIKVTWAKLDGVVQDRPSDWPHGTKAVSTESSLTITYNCETLVDWFYARQYIDYHCGTLYEQRLKLMMKLVQAEYQQERFLEIGDDI